ncbi:hypothetical protein N806_20435 [Rhodococcus sp. P27]|nr:hypothetical protein N806_12165 [Rhodococcus sp. P27]ERB53510.1 hypothetical protein N806_20435 [Rhodococcus sp. P27]
MTTNEPDHNAMVAAAAQLRAVLTGLDANMTGQWDHAWRTLRDFESYSVRASFSEDLVTQLAQAMFNAYEWNDNARVALEFLSSAGRLISDGELRLNVEQVAALRRLMDAQPDAVPEGYELLEALFPPIEEWCIRHARSEVGNSRCSVGAPDEERNRGKGHDDAQVITDTYTAIRKAGISFGATADAINELHNAGLLIRRRTPTSDEEGAR